MNDIYMKRGWSVHLYGPFDIGHDIFQLIDLEGNVMEKWSKVM